MIGARFRATVYCRLGLGGLGQSRSGYSLGGVPVVPASHVYYYSRGIQRYVSLVSWACVTGPLGLGVANHGRQCRLHVDWDRVSGAGSAETQRAKELSPTLELVRTQFPVPVGTFPG